VKADAHMQLHHGSATVPKDENTTAPESQNLGPAETPPATKVPAEGSQDQEPAKNQGNATVVSANKRAKLCKAMQKVNAGKKPLVDALRGMEISAVTNHDANNWVYKKGNKWRGYDVELLKELAQSAGFTFTIYDHPKTNDTGDELDANDRWMMETVQLYDINLDHRSLSARREKKLVVVDYGFMDASMVLVAVRDYSSDISFTTLLAPYDCNTWLAFVAITFLTAAMYYYLEAPKNPEPEAEIDEDKASVWGSLYVTIRQTATVSNLGPKTYQGKFLTVSWAIFSLVFMAGYTANLASCLVALKEGNTPWHSIDDVMNSDARICVNSGVGSRYMQKNYPQYEKVVNTKHEYAVKQMVAGKCEAALDWNANFQIAAEKQELNPNCNLQTVGYPLNSRWGGWSTVEDYQEPYCTGLVRNAIQLHFLMLKESGKLDKLYDKALLGAEKTRKTLCEAPSTEGSDEALTLQSMAGIFIIHSVVLTTAAVGTFLCCNRRAET